MQDFTAIFEALEHCQTTASQFLQAVLTHQHYHDHPVVEDLLLHSTEILDAFLAHPIKNQNFMQHCAKLISSSYLKEIHHVASEDRGWHFGASTATTKQLEDFNLNVMAHDIEVHAPGIWTFVGLLLESNEKQDAGSSSNLGKEKDIDGDVVMDEQSTDVEEDYWNEVDEVDLEGLIEGLTAEGGPTILAKDHRKKHHMATKTIVRA